MDINISSREIARRLRQLDDELRAIQAEALMRANQLTGKDRSLASLHSLIDGKNNTYVDSVRTQFKDPADFIARWIDGLLLMFRLREGTGMQPPAAQRAGQNRDGWQCAPS